MVKKEAAANSLAAATAAARPLPRLIVVQDHGERDTAVAAVAATASNGQSEVC